MSKSVECSRSVSDGDLIRTNRKKSSHFQDHDYVSDIDKPLFFTLPRWMSSGRRRKNKIKYIKVDGSLRNGDSDLHSENKSHLKNFEIDSKPSSFIRKLFRSNSFFNSIKQENSIKRLPQVSTSASLNPNVQSTENGHCNSFDSYTFFKDKCPGLCGLKNHGNTCFINSVIQCLNNTDIFAEYFVMDRYKMDLMRHNKTHSKRYGTRGEVTEQLGGLLKSIWSCQYYSNISSKFKNTVAKFGSQYEGSEQHDAQEFLLWLLDKVHEDLNVASKEKYKKNKGKIGRSDEDIAAEMLANHLRCNSSFIHDLFQGQFRSSLGCLGCGRFSNTFDPYLCLSLPIAQSHCIPVFAYIIFLKEDIKIYRIGLLIDCEATVCDLREVLNTKFGLPKTNVLLVEIVHGEYKRILSDDESVADLKDNLDLFAIELPIPDKNVSLESEKIVLVITNRGKVDGNYEMIWRPFVIEIPREVNYEELENEIFSRMKHVTNKEDSLLKLRGDFLICVADGESVNETLCSSVDMPLYMPLIDQALLNCNPKTPHLKLTIDWNFVDSDLSYIEEHPSVMEVVNSKKQSDLITLQDCLDMYFNEEMLGNEDAWMCPYCNQRLPCIKTLSLWTVPDVLIIHLKRFRQFSSQRMKVTAFVEFPHLGLDMNPYISNRSQGHQLPNNSVLWSPWKRSRCRTYNRIEDNIYELYAVCNHYGTMQGGHYTAYCKNPVNGHWYLFDDIKVQEVQPTEVISNDAYMLFYQRSTSVSPSCASSSSSGYSSASSTYSAGNDHWAFHMSSYFKDTSFPSKSQDNLFDISKTSSLDRRTNSLGRTFDRSSRVYSTMLPSERRSSSKPDLIDFTSGSEEGKPKVKDEIIPPPPPPAKHYWTVTSV